MNLRWTLGFTSVRYHLAFLGYAVAAAGLRTPAFLGLTRRTLASLPLTANVLEMTVLPSRQPFVGRG